MRARTLTRTLLREETRQWILDGIIEGEFTGGETIYEKEVAAALGISRTPVREALLVLEQEGHLRRRDGTKSLYVTELRGGEAASLCHVVGGLEVLALRESGLPPSNKAVVLEQICGELMQPHGERKVLQLEHRWHRLLIGECPNAVLMAILGRTREQVSRYDMAYFRDCGHLAPAALDQKPALQCALRGACLDDVLAELERTWRERGEALAEWLCGTRRKTSRK